MTTKLPKVLISAEDIQKGVKILASELDTIYQGKEVIVICVLKGSFIFCSDLVRMVNFPVTVEFISVSSYGSSKTSSGEIKLNFDQTPCIEGKDVLIVEDIIDTGLTVDYLTNLFKSRKPESLRIVTLLKRKHQKNVGQFSDIDFKVFDLADEFVVGYGLDYGGQFRSLPYLGYIDD